jgi:hypothetical protein
LLRKTSAGLPKKPIRFLFRLVTLNMGRSLAIITEKASSVLQDEFWNQLRSVPSKSAPSNSQTAASDEVFRCAEDFIVGRLSHFLAYVLPQLQQLIFTSLVGVLALLLAVNSYPFHPHNILMTLNWAVILSLVGLATWVFVQMSRNPILSDLNGTKPGQISWDREFVFRIIGYAIVPILALLGTQFPHSIGQILSHLLPSEVMHQ